MREIANWIFPGKKWYATTTPEDGWTYVQGEEKSPDLSSVGGFRIVFWGKRA